MRTVTEVRRLKRENLATLAESEGVGVDEGDTKEDIIGAMQRAGVVESKDGDAKTETQHESKSEEGVGVKKQAGRSPFAHHEHVVLIVHSTDDDDGARPVDVSVNGYNFRIPRDKEVSVPKPVLEVLENAVETRLEEVGRDQVTGAPQFQERHSRRFAFSSRAA